MLSVSLQIYLKGYLFQKGLGTKVQNWRFKNNWLFIKAASTWLKYDKILHVKRQSF